MIGEEVEQLCFMLKGLIKGCFQWHGPEEQPHESGIAVSSQTARRPEAIQLHPMVGRHEGSCYHSHPCHRHPIMAMNSGLCQRTAA